MYGAYMMKHPLGSTHAVCSFRRILPCSKGIIAYQSLCPKAAPHAPLLSFACRRGWFNFAFQAKKCFSFPFEVITTTDFGLIFCHRRYAETGVPDQETRPINFEKIPWHDPAFPLIIIRCFLWLTNVSRPRWQRAQAEDQNNHPFFCLLLWLWGSFISPAHIAFQHIRRSYSRKEHTWKRIPRTDYSKLMCCFHHEWCLTKDDGLWERELA